MNKRKLFGTDGIRGRANRDFMTPDVILKVAMAAGLEFRRGDHRHKVVIGKDTRLSGYMLEPAMASGFVATGMDAMMIGPMPTPAVAMLTRSMRADLGVMLSASHNPYYDNGIKLFGPDGYKLSDEMEARIEARMDAMDSTELAVSDKLGRASRLEDAPGRYNEFVKNTLPRGYRLDGMKIVIDCANGAAYKVAPQVLWELGADVIPIGIDPDGFNINDKCGATHAAVMRAKVIETGADLGIALDGDADRLILADEQGQQIDGDQVMGLIARSWQQSGQLKGGGVVATVMSNLGLERYIADIGLEFVRTPVGDRYVVEKMRKNGYNIGGEQSGHMVLSDYTTTGDGLIAALQVLAVIFKAGLPASKVCRIFRPVPQLLKNVRFAQGCKPLEMAPVSEAIERAEKSLAGDGRLLVRKSGTEPVIRVMAEGDNETKVRKAVEAVCTAIDKTAAA
ncbi:MAG: phosphoglucosamine mutase [Pseudomonadota bacterium]|nr:phosphoglucosamine mutase [Pseudomonadota bacterium]